MPTNANLLTFSNGKLSVGIGPFRADNSLIIGGKGPNNMCTLCVVERKIQILQPELRNSMVFSGRVIAIPHKKGNIPLCVFQKFTQQAHAEILYLRIINSEVPRTYFGEPKLVTLGKTRSRRVSQRGQFIFDSIFRLQPNEALTIVTKGKNMVLFNYNGQVVWIDFKEWTVLKSTLCGYENYIFPTIIDP